MGSASTPIRLGLVGSGAVMGQHLRGFGATGRTRIVGVVSGRQDRARALAERHGARAYEGISQLLDQAAPDAMVVGVPPHRNPGICRVLVERGVPFLTEKPLAADDDAAVDALSGSILAASLVTAVGYQLRAVEFVPELRRLLAERPPALVIGRWLTDTPGPDWWARADQGGGQVVEQQTHQFDLARALLGEASVVGAASGGRSRSTSPGADVAGAGAAVLRFTNGAVGSFASTNVLPAGGVAELQFVSDGRSVTMRWHGWPIATYELEVTDDHGTTSTVAGADPWQTQAEAFLDAVKRADTSLPFSTYPDAAESYRLTRRIVAAAGGVA